MELDKKDLALLQKFLHGKCSEEEWMRAKAMMQQLDAQSGLERLIDDFWEEESVSLPNADALYQNITQSIQIVPASEQTTQAHAALPDQEAGLPKLGVRRFNPRQLLQYAAIGLFLLASTFWLIQHRQPTAPSSEETTWLSVNTGKGERKTIVLPDSSRIVLNALSSVKYPSAFAKSQRTIQLAGEAFFQVTPDKTHPFSVQTNQLTVTVLGTSFNVKSVPNQSTTEVAVVSGKVAVSRINPLDTVVVSLTAHESARYSHASDRLEKVFFPDESTLFWKDNILAFRNVSFPEVIARLENFYGVSIQVTGNHVTQKPYTGSFRNERLENVLESLGYTLEFGYTLTNKQVTIHFK